MTDYKKYTLTNHFTISGLFIGTSFTRMLQLFIVNAFSEKKENGPPSDRGQCL